LAKPVRWKEARYWMLRTRLLLKVFGGDVMVGPTIRLDWEFGRNRSTMVPAEGVAQPEAFRALLQGIGNGALRSA
jgi:hypothetical protein